MAGVEKGVRAHVQIFQLWFAMFSLASSALLEPSPEKLSDAHNSRLPLPEAQSPSLPREQSHQNIKNQQQKKQKQSEDKQKMIKI